MKSDGSEKNLSKKSKSKSLARSEYQHEQSYVVQNTLTQGSKNND